MNLYFDVDAGYFVTGPGTRERVDTLSFKRGDTVSIAVRFVSGITVQELAGGASGKIGLKEEGEYDADFVASDSAWTKTGTGTSTVYTFQLNLATSELNALLNDDGTEGNDVASVDLMFEMEYTVSGVTTSSNTITATVHNDVVKGDETGPTLLGGTVPPVNAAAAAVTINPAGADNSVIYTAATAGADGNDITVAYATPASQNNTGVAVVGSAITVTPGTTARKIVTGTLSPDATGTLLYAGQDSGVDVWSSDGELTAAVSGVWVELRDDGIQAQLLHYTDSVQDGEWSGADQSSLTPQAPATGTPSVASGTSSAAQVITAVNANGASSALVTASASGTVTGAVAAVTATSLTGGVDATEGYLGSMKVDSSYLYVVASVSSGVPTWKKISLSSL